MLHYTIDQTGPSATVYFDGDLDIDTTELIEIELTDLLQKFDRIAIEFQDVRFVDSSGMGLLLTLVQSLKAEGKGVYIKRVREDVMEVFELLQIPEILGRNTFIR
ncbi:STAS domain-containing protein [Jeotgalibacillus sp. R-1-5s-1]|uniref:STAS domain-containing protein n=1 Tax=Jeotgalibacillus sp. R-1-5s-1 TaxID=2555897 RepID=UPI00106A9D3B|nr:STAS domain-containing protein [Jeotgalibacillus sp. R-1-5s-1]TFD95777.1 anti-sigma factor antagonist [Jeotgalibacillus sp. R-1-5s-1]